MSAASGGGDGIRAGGRARSVPSARAHCAHRVVCPRSMLETDGPYGGGSCASTSHSHVGLSDSIYQQTKRQATWYAGLRERNVYINQPDNYL